MYNCVLDMWLYVYCSYYMCYVCNGQVAMAGVMMNIYSYIILAAKLTGS